MLKWRLWWERLHTSLWFVPGVILLLAVILALLLVQLDLVLTDKDFYQRWQWLFGSGAEGARVLLSTVAGSMITVAGVAFSITIVALSLASNQYTPRLLRNFMRDRVNQVVLGLFVGIFAYCLVVLRTIRGREEMVAGAEVFVPMLAVFVGLLLAFVGVAVFIYFIHHISVSIQAVDILAAITDETLNVIERQYPQVLLPEMQRNDVPPPSLAITLERQAAPVAIANCNGYLQSFDVDAIVSLALEHRLQIYSVCRVGDFVVKEGVLALSEGAVISDELLQQLSSCFAIGRQRTVEQDMGFGIRQIVDVAIKALSPGINDTTTAVMCVHYLTGIACKLSQRDIRCDYYAGTHKAGNERATRQDDWRFMTPGPLYADLMQECFAEIRHNARGNVTVLTALLKAMQTLLHCIQQLPGAVGRAAVVEALVTQLQETIDQSRMIPSERERLVLQVQQLLQQARAD